MSIVDNFLEFVATAKIAAYIHDLGKGIVSAYGRKKFDGDLDLQEKLPDHETILLGFVDPQIFQKQHVAAILESMAFHHKPSHLSKIVNESEKLRKRGLIKNLDNFLKNRNSKANALMKTYEILEECMVKDVQQKGSGYYTTLLVKLADELASELDRPVAYEGKTDGNKLQFGRTWCFFSVKANPASYSPELMTSDFNNVIKEANGILTAAEAVPNDKSFKDFFNKVRKSSILKHAPQGSHPPVLARSIFSHSLWMSVILQSIIYAFPEIRNYAATRQKGEDCQEVIKTLLHQKKSISPSISIIIIDFSCLKTHLESIKSFAALRGYAKFHELVIQTIINCMRNETFSMSINGMVLDVPVYWEDNIIYQSPTQIWVALPNDSALIEKTLEAIKTNFPQELKKIANEKVPDTSFPLITIPLKVKRLLPVNKTYKVWGREIVRTAWEGNFEDLTLLGKMSPTSIKDTCRHCGKPSPTEGDTCNICLYLINLREKVKSEEICDENGNSMYLHGSVTYAEPWLIGMSTKSIIKKVFGDDFENIPHGHQYSEVQVRVKDNNVKLVRPTLAAFKEPRPYDAFVENMGSVFYLAKTYHWITKNYNWINEAGKLLEEKSQTANLLKYIFEGDSAFEDILQSIEAYSNEGSSVNDRYFLKLLEYCLKEKDAWSKHIMLNSMLTPLAFYVPSEIAEHHPEELKEAPSPTYLSEIYILMEDATNRFIKEIERYIPNYRKIYLSPQEFLLLLPCKDGLTNIDAKSPVMEALKAYWKTANGLPEECEIPDKLMNDLPLTLNLVLVCGKHKLPVYLFMDKLKDEKVQGVNIYHLSSSRSPLLFNPSELDKILEYISLLNNEGGRALILAASALYKNLSKDMEEKTALKITQEWVTKQLKRSDELSKILKSNANLDRYITLNLSKLILLLNLVKTSKK